MKKLFNKQFFVKIFIFSVLLFFCDSNAFSQKEIFLRQIEFKLERVSDIDYENEYFMTIKFNKGVTYNFAITNHIENFAGQAVFEILDADKLVLTNFMDEKYFENFSFVCNKTGFYDILIRFKDNKVGNSIIDIKLVQ